MLTNPAIHDNLIHYGKISVEIISAVATAAVAATGIVSFHSSPAQVETPSQVQTVKVDRINVASPVRKCSEQAWPYYEPRCLWFNGKLGETRTVRVIPIDRMQTANSTPTDAK